MAILNYDGTNLTSLASSGFFRRYYSEFQDNSGQVWRIEILDSTTTNDGFSFADDDPQYFVLGRDGFTLDWDGKTDTAHSPFISSSLTFDFLVDDIKTKQLVSVLGGTTDERFAIGLFKHIPNASTSSTSTTVQDANPTGYWAPEWFGILIPEDVQVLDNEPNSFVRIKASDGLSILNSVDYSNDGALYENKDSLAKTISRCLGKIPTSSLWGFNEYDNSTTPNTAIDNADTALVIPAFFREYIYQYSETHKDAGDVIQSVLYHTEVYSPSWYDVSQSSDHFGGILTAKDALTCAGVLRNILQVFQARLFLSGGSWTWQNPGALIEDSTPRVYEWVTQAKMVDGTDAEGSTLTTNKIDIDGEGLDPLKGLVESYSFPIYQALSKHKKGGAGILLQAPYPTGWVMGVNDGYITDQYPWYRMIYDDYDGTIVTLKNLDALIEDTTELTISGLFKLDETGFGPQALHLDAVGMFAVWEIFIKVGNYYLKRDLSFSGAGDTCVIQRTAATDFTQQFLEQSGNVEWTTTQSSYSLVMPYENMDNAALMPQGSGDNEVTRVGGLHVQRRDGNNDDEFKYRSGNLSFGWEDFGTQVAGMGIDLSWVLPPLPSNAAGHQGIEFNAYMDYYSREGVKFDASERDDIFAATFPGEIRNFRITAGLENSNADAIFTASNDTNRAVIKLGESILGGVYNDAPASNGALFYRDAETNATGIANHWKSLGQTTQLQLHQLNVNDRCQQRRETRRIKSGTFSFTVDDFMPAWNNVTRKQLPTLQELSSITLAGTAFNCVPFTITWTAKTRTIDFSGVAISYNRTSPITEADTTKDLKDSWNTGVGPVVDPNDPITEVWNGKGPANWITDDGIGGIVSLKASTGAGAYKTITFQGANDINLQTDHTNIGVINTRSADNATDIVALKSTVSTSGDDVTIKGGGSSGEGVIKLSQGSGNEDIIIDPNGTGSIVLKSNTIKMEGVSGIDVGSVKFYEAPLLQGNYVAFNAPLSIASDVNWTLPATDGSSGQAMSTNGSGTLAWTSFITSVNPATQGTLQLSTVSVQQGKIQFYDYDGSNYLVLTAPTNVTTNYTLTLPPDAGAANQVLKTDGSGTTSWVDQSGGGGGESGWFNSTTLMKVMPTEFMSNSTNELMIDDATTDNVHVRCSDARGSITVYAIKAIPTGYKATHVQVYGTNATSTSNSVTVRVFDQTDGDLTQTTSGNMNSSIDILDITSSATANILIKVDLNSHQTAGQDDLFGADITIAAV